MNKQSIRDYFPVTKELVYLNHAATGPLHLKTKEALEQYLDHFSRFGVKDYDKWANKVETIRQNLATFIGASSDEIAFVKNTSAGISIFANGLDFKRGDNVIVPRMEFPANIYPWLNLQSQGVEVKLLEFDNNFIDIEKIESQFDKNTRVLAISWVEFLNGYRNDLKALSEMCQRKSHEYKHKIYFCVDIIQGLGMLELNLSEIEIDFAAADGHKWFLAMEGAGLIYCNKKILPDIRPISVGWKSIKDKLNFTTINFDLDNTARKFEEGSSNLAGTMSLGASLDLFNQVGIKEVEKTIFELTDHAINSLEKKNINVVSSKETKHRSGIVSFKVDNPEQVFQKMIANNVQLSLRGNLLRISPHFYNTPEEIDKFLSLL